MPEVAYGVAVVAARAPDGDETGSREVGASRVLVVRRPEEGLLGGLWEFPGVEMDGGEAPERAAVRAARSEGVRPGGKTVALEPVKHAYSHFRGTYHPFLFRVAEADEETEARRWVSAADLEALPLPRAQRRIAQTLEARR